MGFSFESLDLCVWLRVLVETRKWFVGGVKGRGIAEQVIYLFGQSLKCYNFLYLHALVVFNWIFPFGFHRMEKSDTNLDVLPFLTCILAFRFCLNF